MTNQSVSLIAAIKAEGSQVDNFYDADDRDRIVIPVERVIALIRQHEAAQPKKETALKNVRAVLDKYYPDEASRLYGIFTGYVLNVYEGAKDTNSPVSIHSLEDVNKPDTLIDCRKEFEQEFSNAGYLMNKGAGGVYKQPNTLHAWEGFGRAWLLRQSEITFDWSDAEKDKLYDAIQEVIVKNDTEFSFAGAFEGNELFNALKPFLRPTMREIVAFDDVRQILEPQCKNGLSPNYINEVLKKKKPLLDHIIEKINPDLVQVSFWLSIPKHRRKKKNWTFEELMELVKYEDETTTE